MVFLYCFEFLCFFLTFSKRREGDSLSHWATIAPGATLCVSIWFWLLMQQIHLSNDFSISFSKLTTPFFCFVKKLTMIFLFTKIKLIYFFLYFLNLSKQTICHHTYHKWICLHEKIFWGVFFNNWLSFLAKF